jgi:Na+/melibiose symporter-like transporter
VNAPTSNEPAAEAERAPLGVSTKLAHGVGSMAFAAKDAAVVNFVPFFYTQVVGLSGTLYGAAAFIGQLSDAISDPVVGTLSDNHRSRWGRRHPFMAFAAIPVALCFLFIFMPPALGQWGLFLWLAAGLVALRTFLTFFAIPHTALGAELSSDYEERSLIVSYRTMLGWVAGVGLPFVGLFYLFSRDGTGDGGAEDGRLIYANYTDYAIISAAVALVTIAATVWFTRKRIPSLPTGGPKKKLRWTEPIHDVRHALQNRNFRWVFSALIFVGASSGVAVTLGFYANTYFWEFTSEQMAMFGLFNVVPIGAGFAALRPLVRWFEKQTIFAGALAVMILNGLWWIPGRLLDVLPANGDPLLFYLALVNSFFLVSSVMILQTLGAAIVADIVDEHEVHTGERMDGVFFAAMGFSMKVPTGLGQFLGGAIIQFAGLATGAEPGDVPGDVLFKLGVIAGPIISLSFILPGLLLTRFDLSRERHAELRLALEARETTPSED